ncbi:sialidase family protein [Halomonas chromatireducens]|uniref:BNR/Asp-box repeat protein n=1 Tax=Halomonas chromatireducens TaxID=507626 RepID=A0A120JWB0_9GAMM|nr:sialidase family protein [Halomonas chromatireducens]AMD01586.1 hypothetical protein LOKO_02526 [Halomonas chromatireducens]
MSDVVKHRLALHLSCSSLRQTALLATASLLLTLAAPSIADEGPITWQPALQIASGEAHVGPWRMNKSDFRYVDDPTVALHQDGTAAVLWVDQAQQDVFFQAIDRNGEPQHDEPTNVSRSGDTFSWLPRLVIAGDDPDTLYVLWQEIIFSGGSHGGDILFARSQDGGMTFSEPLNLSRSREGAGKGRLTEQRWDNGSLDLAEGPDGTIWAAWTTYEGDLYISHSQDGGNTFAQPQPVARDDARPARAPSLAVDDEGRVHLAWSVGEDPAANIHYTLSDSSGAILAEPAVVATSRGHSDAPSLAVDANGTLHLAYAEAADGPGQPSRLYYTRADHGERFATPRPLVEEQSEDAAGHGYPSIAVAGSHVHLTWERFPDPRQRPRGLGIMHSWDSGETFSSPSIVPESVVDIGFNGNLQGLLTRKLAVNHNGDIAVVNSTFQPDEASHAWLIRGRYER